MRFRDGLVWTVGLTVEIQMRLRDGLVWTVGLTVEIQMRFRDGLVWTVGLTVEIQMRFRDGLVWTVGLTVEMKLRFQISPAYFERFSLKVFPSRLYLNLCSLVRSPLLGSCTSHNKQMQRYFYRAVYF